MGVGEAGGDCGGPLLNRPGEIEQSEVAVEGEGVEVRMNDDLLDLYLLLAWIGTLLVVVTCRHTHTQKTQLTHTFLRSD